MADPGSGILLVDKKEGESSFHVVRNVRKVTGARKVGHAGTLDPFATGLLVVLVGEATKLSPFLMRGDKEYRTTIRLGIETDTMDPTGKVMKTSSVPPMDPEVIRKCSISFTGEIEQSPPMFSALKCSGKRAYELARKGIQATLKKRKVFIHRLEIVSTDLPDMTMLVTCSGGTYIRSLAADLGRQLGPGAHVRSLRRLRSGSFNVAHALDSGSLESGCPREDLSQRLIPLRKALPEMAEILVDEKMASRIRQGYRPKWDELNNVAHLQPVGEGHVKVVDGEELVAIMRIGRSEDSRLEGVRVFHRSNT